MHTKRLVQFFQEFIFQHILQKISRRDSRISRLNKKTNFVAKRTTCIAASFILISFATVNFDNQKYPENSCVDFFGSYLCSPLVTEKCFNDFRSEPPPMEFEKRKSELTPEPLKPRLEVGLQGIFPLANAIEHDTGFMRSTSTLNDFCIPSWVLLPPGIALPPICYWKRKLRIVIEIESPPDKSIFVEGTNIEFIARATENSQGADISGQIQWSSLIDGNLGTGRKITKNDLSIKDDKDTIHKISAKIVYHGKEYSDSIDVIINTSCIREAIPLDSLAIPADVASALPCEILPLWNRLEARSRSNDISQSLQAQVRDPYWFMFRQFQLSEFEAESAGSPINAYIEYKNSKFDKIKFKKEKDTDPEYKDLLEIPGDQNSNPLPFEKIIEKEKIIKENQDNLIFNWKTIIEIGKQFENFLGFDSVAKTIIEKFQQHQDFKIPNPDNGNNELNSLDNQTKNFLRSMYGRSINGKKLYDLFIESNPQFPTSLGLTEEQAIKANNALVKLKNWFNSIYPKVETHDSMGWNHESLQHKFKIEAPWYEANQKIILDSDYDGNPDWYTFSIESPPKNSSDLNTSKENLVPSNLLLTGMPNLRWWEFEDSLTDLGDIFTNVTDLGKILLTDFAFRYANDWYGLSIPVPIGSLSEIKKLVITDVFGDTTDISTSSSIDNEGWKGWNMFGISVNNQQNDNPANQISVANVLCLPATLSRREESPALEHVQFLRDEGANMVYAIEHMITNGLGLPQPGYESYRDFNSQDENEISDLLKYKISKIPPENWIPYIPVHSDNQRRAIQFMRGGLLDQDTRVPLKPKTTILKSAGEDDGKNHTVNEEAVSLPGLRIKMNYQRARWLNGTVHTWLGRTIKSGSGQADSGLKFDFITEKEKNT